MSEPLGGLLAAPPSIVAAGVGVFSAALRQQGAGVTDVDWRPPGFGSADDLAQLALDPRRAAANRGAGERGVAARAGGAGGVGVGRPPPARGAPRPPRRVAPPPRPAADLGDGVRPDAR